MNHMKVMLTKADPTTQADFGKQVVPNTTDVDPGHQCYKVGQLESAQAGQNATIQLEYWAEFEGENDGKNQSFFACADIVRIELVLRCNATLLRFTGRPSSRPKTSIYKSHALTSRAMTSAHPRLARAEQPTLVFLLRRLQHRIMVEEGVFRQARKLELLSDL